MKIAQNIAGRTVYVPLFDLVREYAYAVRWDHDDLETYTAAVIAHALEWAGEGHRTEATATARKCARWTWDHFTERR